MFEVLAGEGRRHLRGIDVDSDMVSRFSGGFTVATDCELWSDQGRGEGLSDGKTFSLDYVFERRSIEIQYAHIEFEISYFLATKS